MCSCEAFLFSWKEKEKGGWKGFFTSYPFCYLMKIKPIWEHTTEGTIRDLSFSSKDGDVAVASSDKSI